MQRGTALMKNSTHNSSKPPSTHSSSCEFAERKLFWSCSQGMKPQQLSVCEDFRHKTDAERASRHIIKISAPPRPANLQSKSYFEAARRGWNRSILGVCEDFRLKADAERAPLCRFAPDAKKIRCSKSRTPYNQSNLLDYLFFLS